MTKALPEPGHNIDAGTLYKMHNGAHIHITTYDLLETGRAVLFGGPAPFSRLDTQQAIEYAELNEEMLKYVDVVYGVYCQDAFVMDQFDMHIKKFQPNSKIEFYGDGDGYFTRGHNLQVDFSNQGLSLRSGRYAMIVKDRKLEQIFYDDYSTIKLTSAANVLDWLKNNET